MRQMKDSGIQWIKEIPVTWKLKKNKYNLTLDKSIIGAKWENTQLLSLTKYGVKAINDGEQTGKVPTSLATYQKVSVNDIVMCLFDLDCSAVFSGKSDFDGMISPAYKCFKCLPHLYPQYVDYYFRTVFIDRKYMRYSKNVRYSLNADEFMALPILVPPFDEQERIAAFLDKECSKIDSIYADVEKQIEILEQYKHSVIKETVTRGLDKTVELQGTNVVWASQIPKHWSVMPNKYIMSKIKRICDVHKGEDIISLSMNGVIVRDLEAGGKMPATFNGYQFVYPGNLLMCLFDYDVTPRCIGYINDYGVTSPAYSQFVMKNGNSAKYYYYYYLMIDNTKELLHLAKNLRHSFTEDELGKIAQVVPPIEEQESIADYLDKKCAEIESVIADKKKQLEVLENYKKSLIYEYVTGKKEVVNE